MTNKTAKLLGRLQEAGFTWDEALKLRRIEKTLHRWAEHECNGEIERDEKTGKPERVSQAYCEGRTDKRHAWPIADREAGALRRLAGIMAGHPEWVSYHQTDPRGCALYIVRRADVPTDHLVPIEFKAGWSIIRPGEDCDRAYGCRLKTKAEAVALAAAETLSAFYSRGLAVCD